MKSSACLDILRRAHSFAAADARKLWHDLTRFGYSVQAEYARNKMREELKAARFYRHA